MKIARLPLALSSVFSLTLLSLSAIALKLPENASGSLVSHLTFTHKNNSAVAPAKAQSLYINVQSGADRLLIFWALGSSDKAVRLISSNVQHAREQLEDNVDVYFAHYDSKRSVWLQRKGQTWYDHNVNFWAEEPGYKIQLMKKLLLVSQFDLMRYKWVWSLDEDVSFRATNLLNMLELTKESAALIATPAFTEPHNQHDEKAQHNFQLPNNKCRFRYTPFVEVTQPLFSTASLKKLLTSCRHCWSQNSVWGLDHMWCSWVARNMGSDRSKACAIIDETPTEHLSFRTLKGKYSEDGSKNPDFAVQAMSDKVRVWDRYPEDYIADPQVKQLQCVPHLAY